MDLYNPCTCPSTQGLHMTMSRRHTHSKCIRTSKAFNMAKVGRTTCVCVLLVTTLCSVACDESRSGSHPAHQGRSYKGMSGSYPDKVHLFRTAQIVRDKHDIHKRETESKPADGTLLCNDVTEQRKWTCRCQDCPPSDTKQDGSSSCCFDSLDMALINQRIVILLSNASLEDVDRVLESKIKVSVARSLSEYCGERWEECSSAINVTEDDQLDAWTKSPFGENSNATLFTEHDVVVVNVSLIIGDNDVNDLVVSLFVLTPMYRSINSNRFMDVAVPGDLLEKAVLSKTTSLETYIGHDVISVQTITQTTYDEEVIGLPVKAIIAGAVLGFFLVLCCLISAIKAVRDRRLIKERNVAKREKKRHQELKDSLRRSPLKQKLAEYAVNGDVPATSSNGDVFSVPVSTQVVEVVVHTDSDSAGGDVQSNGVTTVGHPDIQHTVTTYGEVHTAPRETTSLEDKTPNGLLAQNTSQTNGLYSASYLSPSDAFVQRTLDTSNDNAAPHVVDNTHDNTSAPVYSNLDNGVSVGNPNYVGNNAKAASEATGNTSEVNTEAPERRPGRVNPAYDGE